MDGPVVKTAQAALEKGDVTPVLKWVKPEHEAEIRDAFQKTLAVRGLGKDARDLADKYFFETLVRLHREGEGAPYTGLKPAGAVEPVMAASDKALEAGSVDELTQGDLAACRRGDSASVRRDHGEEATCRRERRGGPGVRRGLRRIHALCRAAAHRCRRPSRTCGSSREIRRAKRTSALRASAQAFTLPCCWKCLRFRATVVWYAVVNGLYGLLDRSKRGYENDCRSRTTQNRPSEDQSFQHDAACQRLDRNLSDLRSRDGRRQRMARS